MFTRSLTMLESIVIPQVLHSWGAPLWGVLGHGSDRRQELLPRPIEALQRIGPVVAASAGHRHVLAVTRYPNTTLRNAKFDTNASTRVVPTNTFTLISIQPTPSAPRTPCFSFFRDLRPNSTRRFFLF